MLDIFGPAYVPAFFAARRALETIARVRCIRSGNSNAKVCQPRQFTRGDKNQGCYATADRYDLLPVASLWHTKQDRLHEIVMQPRAW